MPRATRNFRIIWQPSGRHFRSSGGWKAATSESTLAGGRSITRRDRKSTRLNSSHSQISYAVFCLKKKKKTTRHQRDKLLLDTAPTDHFAALTLSLTIFYSSAHLTHLLRHIVSTTYSNLQTLQAL